MIFDVSPYRDKQDHIEDYVSEGLMLQLSIGLGASGFRE